MAKIVSGTFNGTGAGLYVCCGFIPDKVVVRNLEATTCLVAKWSRHCRAKLQVEGVLETQGVSSAVAIGAGIIPYRGGETLTVAMQSLANLVYGEGAYIGFDKKDYKGVAAFLNFLAQNDMQELWHMETGYFPITIAAYESLKKKGYFDENPYQEVGIQQMTRRKPTKNSRGLRLGYFVQIRNIINEEMELIWNGSKTPQQAMDDAVSRSNEKLREFEKTYK